MDTTHSAPSSIPKIIHYCWFGGKPLPPSARRCIASWRKYLPGYEIKEWNEKNFDVNIVPYTREAYAARKYAFVSDYARFWVLYHYGGLYFDTDVEIIHSLDDILARGPFMGLEKNAHVPPEGAAPGSGLGVAPGLGLGANPGLGLYKDLLDYYATLPYLGPDGKPIEGTIVKHTTRVLYRLGLPLEVEEPMQVAGVWIYPPEYFCPMDSTTGITTLTPQTVSIHHYDCSWQDHRTLRFRLHRLKNALYRMLGQKAAERLNRLLRRNGKA